MARRKLTKKQRQTRNRWIVGIIIGLLLFFGGYFLGRQNFSGQPVRSGIEKVVTDLKNWWQGIEQSAERTQTRATFQVHVLDVGQGSSMLLQAEDGTNILIDTGPHDDSDKRILTYLDQYIGSGGDIDLLILTHNHSDHIGLTDDILRYYNVEKVWMNGVDTDTDTYLNVLEAIDASEASYEEPKAGHTAQIGPFELLVLHPSAQDTTDDQNRQSLATKIIINGVSIVQTGDASQADEELIMSRFNDVSADILIAGHHGSNTSSSEEWVRAVNPDIAIYSAGLNNSYGHPSEETVETYRNLNIPLYGTDANGSVHIYSEEYGAFRYEVEKSGE